MIDTLDVTQLIGETRSQRIHVIKYYYPRWSFLTTFLTYVYLTPNRIFFMSHSLLVTLILPLSSHYQVFFLKDFIGYFLYKYLSFCYNNSTVERSLSRHFSYNQLQTCQRPKIVRSKTLIILFCFSTFISCVTISAFYSSL